MSVIAATSTPAAIAAKSVTTTAPVVFTTSGDPAQLGLVSSLATPGGNLTGTTKLNTEMATKRRELLHEALPNVTETALLSIRLVHRRRLAAGSTTWGEVLKGEKPGDMPVLQPTKFTFVINLKTAMMLDLTIPPSILARADEVIE